MSAGAPDPVPRLARLEQGFTRFAAGPAIALMAFAAVYDRGLANLGLALLLLGFLLVIPRYWRALARDPVAWITVLFACWIPIAGARLADAHPDLAGVVDDSAQLWLKVCFIPALVTGFWLSHVPRLLKWVPLILASGYLLRVVGSTDWQLLLQLASGDKRAEYGMVATHFGLFSLIALAAALAGLGAARDLSSRWLRRGVYAYAALIAVVATGGVVFAQTRSVWLASIALGLAVAGFHIRRGGKPPRDGRRLAALLAGAALALGLAIWAFGGIVTERLITQSDAIAKVLTLDFDELGYNPIGYRIRAYAIGLQAWTEAPVLGHGPGIDRIRMLTASDPEMRRIAHFHNEYLNVLATHGVVGFVLLGAVLVAAARGGLRLFRAGDGGAPVAGFMAACGIATAVFSGFDQVLASHYMPFVVALLLGMGLSASGRYTRRAAPAGPAVDHRAPVAPRRPSG